MMYFFTLNHRIMKIDNYTKVVLTIIAIALTLNLFIGATSSNNLKLNEDGSLNVRVMTMPETIDVNIDEVGGGYVPYSKLPVAVKEGSIDVDNVNDQVHVWVDN